MLNEAMMLELGRDGLGQAMIHASIPDQVRQIHDAEEGKDAPDAVGNDESSQEEEHLHLRKPGKSSDARPEGIEKNDVGSLEDAGDCYGVMSVI
jgi:hypothetical protein